MIKVKKITSIIVFSLLWCSIVQSQEFYPNKELDINKLINFDLTKYEFKDFDKIIGNKVKSWDGDVRKLNEASKDWKKIDIKIKGINHELQFSHLKSGGVDFFLLIRGMSCEASKAIIPEKYINRENSLNYTIDHTIAKIYIDKFSFDTKINTRLVYGCMTILGADNKANVEDTTSTIRIANIEEPNFSNIIPLKMIRCKIVKSKTKYKIDFSEEKTLNNNYTTLKEPQFLDYYISDSEKNFLNKKFQDVGNRMFRFDKDLIHTEQRYKLDKTKVDRLVLYEEYKIDRIYGDFLLRKIIYDKKYVHAGAPNNELEIEFKGKCVKKDIEERAF